MLKAELKNLDGIDDSIKSFYKQDGDVFRLQVDGLEDVGELKRAHERVKQERNELRDQLTESKTKYEEADQKLRDALANGNNEEKIESLRTSYEDKIARLNQEKADEIGSRDKFIEKTLIDNRAIELAGGLAVDGASKVLLPHIRSRLSIEKAGEDYKTVVLGVDGKPSAATLDDLKTEFANDAAFAHVVVGSKATGGGANGGNPGDARQKTVTRTQFDGMGHAERASFAKEGGKVVND